MPAAGDEGDTNSERYPLIRGHHKIMLIRDLAAGMSLNEASDKHSVHRHSLLQFRQRHRTEIDELKKEVRDELVGLWVARKVDRMWSLQQNVDDIDEMFSSLAKDGMLIGKDDAGLLAEKRKILHEVAEQLGQLPPRASTLSVGATVTYQYGDVEPDDLT